MNPLTWHADPEIRKLIQQNENQDVARLALHWSKLKDLPIQWMLQQITGRQIAKQKLPEWYAVEEIIYPDRTALEQCSSTITALYKQRFVSGKIVADITGGLGVDTWALASVAEKILYCEPDAARYEVAQHNFAALGLENILCLNQTAENSLEALQQFKPEVIYLDPSRRVKGQRFFKLDDLQPDITTLFPQLLKIANSVVLKAAPMLDIKLGFRQLKQVQDVHVLSVKNECRETLFHITNQQHDDPVIHCVEFNAERDWHFEFRYSEEEAAEIKISPIHHFLLDPYACITKAGCYNTLAQEYHIELLNANTHLYTAAEKPKGFPGRCFKVMAIHPYDIGLLREYLPEKKAHLLFRNFPVKAEEVEKKLKFTASGNIYLLFLTDHLGHRRVVVGEAA